jgi:hypothetical protein
VGPKISRVIADAVSVIVSAVSAGAVAGAKDTVAQAVKDAYAGLKKLITERYAHVDVTAVEKKPESMAKRDSLGEDLQDAGHEGFWSGIRRQSLFFLLVNGVLSDLKHAGRFGHMRNRTRP